MPVACYTNKWICVTSLGPSSSLRLELFPLMRQAHTLSVRKPGLHRTGDRLETNLSFLEAKAKKGAVL